MENNIYLVIRTGGYYGNVYYFTKEKGEIQINSTTSKPFTGVIKGEWMSEYTEYYLRIKTVKQFKEDIKEMDGVAGGIEFYFYDGDLEDKNIETVLANCIRLNAEQKLLKELTNGKISFQLGYDYMDEKVGDITIKWKDKSIQTTVDLTKKYVNIISLIMKLTGLTLEQIEEIKKEKND